MILNGKLIWSKKKKSRQVAGEEEQEKAGEGREGKHSGDARGPCSAEDDAAGTPTTATANTRAQFRPPRTDSNSFIPMTPPRCKEHYSTHFTDEEAKSEVR